MVGNMEMMVKELKSYKGYGIDKIWWVDEEDGKMNKKRGYVYVGSQDDEYVTGEFKSAEELKAYIDSVVK